MSDHRESLSRVCKENSIFEGENLTKNSSHLNEKIYFEEHLNDILPENHQLGDIFTANRMLGYVDAIMAASATFLVEPIKYIDKNEANGTFTLFLNSMRTEFIMFFLGFTIVLTIWDNINVRSMVVKSVDDFVLTFVILELLATTALPFSLYLQGSNPTEYVPIILTCCVLGFVQVLDIMLIFYAMETPRILHKEVQKWSKTERRRFRNIILIRPAFSFVLILIGGVLCLVNYYISWGFIAILTLVPIIRSLFLFVRRRMKTSKKMEKYQFYFYFSKENIPKERIEIMSDAAIAIIACLLILDITKYLPNNSSHVNNDLKESQFEFYAFLATFAIVSTLWYVNHCLIHMFRTITTTALYIQKLFLAFCCLCPLAANMIVSFGTKDDESSNISIRYAGLIVFSASMGNFFLFLYGFLTKEKYLHHWAAFGRSLNTMSRQNKYVLFKAINVPFWSLLCTLGSLSPPKVALYVLCACFLATPLSFFIAKLVFMNHFKKSLHSREFQFDENKNSEVFFIKVTEESKESIGTEGKTVE